MTQTQLKPNSKMKTAIADVLAVTLVGSLSITGYIAFKNHLRPLAASAVESTLQLFRADQPAPVDPVAPENGLTNDSSADQPMSVDPVAAVAAVAPVAPESGLTNESSADQPMSVDPVATVAPAAPENGLTRNESSVSVALQLEAPSTPLSPAQPQFTRLQASGCAGPASCYMSRQR